MAKKDAADMAERKAKENRMKAGRNQGMSGRDLFDFNPDLALDEEEDEDALDLSMYERREDDEAEEETINNGVSSLSVKE